MSRVGGKLRSGAYTSPEPLPDVPEPALGMHLKFLSGEIDSTTDLMTDDYTLYDPPEGYDTYLNTAIQCAPPSSTPILTPWTDRVFSSDHVQYVSVTAKRKYKPVHRKVRPVPSYMPNPSAQKFKPVIITEPSPLPHNPPPLSDFIPTQRLTREHLDKILKTVPVGFLTTDEIDLMVFVLVRIVRRNRKP